MVAATACFYRPDAFFPHQNPCRVEFTHFCASISAFGDTPVPRLLTSPIDGSSLEHPANQSSTVSQSWESTALSESRVHQWRELFWSIDSTLMLDRPKQNAGRNLLHFLLRTQCFHAMLPWISLLHLPHFVYLPKHGEIEKQFCVQSSSLSVESCIFAVSMSPMSRRTSDPVVLHFCSDV
jgi:hypothetical protein